MVGLSSALVVGLSSGRNACIACELQIRYKTDRSMRRFCLMKEGACECYEGLEIEHVKITHEHQAGRPVLALQGMFIPL